MKKYILLLVFLGLGIVIFSPSIAEKLTYIYMQRNGGYIDTNYYNIYFYTHYETIKTLGEIITSGAIIFLGIDILKRTKQ